MGAIGVNDQINATKTAGNTKVGDQLASTILFSLAEIVSKSGKFASSIGISKTLNELHVQHCKIEYRFHFVKKISTSSIS